jgi:flagellar hook-associated protein 1
MASDLLSIAGSGAKAARIALDVTAQNIANAASEGYVRRSVRLEEVASAGGYNRIGDVSLSGVRLDAVVRNADSFRQAEVRRTGADAARASAEVAGLENIEAAVEQSNVFQAVVQFEGALQQLAADPVDASLRAAVVEDARTMVRTFNIAATSLEAVGNGLRFEAADGVSQVNLLAGELSRVNLRLARASDASSDQTALLDQRDLLLQKLSEQVDVSTTIGADQTVQVRLGGPTGGLLVNGGAASPLAMTTAPDGTIGFTLGGNAVAPTGGALAGKALALDKLVDVRSGLNAVAAGVIATANAAQANGVALDGTAGSPLFGGSDAATMSLALQDGRGLATAPAGAGANSRDSSNLSALRSALAANDPAGGMDALIFDISGTVAGRTITRDALLTIAGSASIALESQAGVDLDQEALNLVRFQQSFQASARAMQVAGELFDSLLAIR